MSRRITSKGNGIRYCRGREQRLFCWKEKKGKSMLTSGGGEVVNPFSFPFGRSSRFSLFPHLE